jgi:hypothetical protein
MNSTTSTRKNRQTGTLVTVINAANAHLCDGAGTTKWYAICENHNCLCGFSTKKLATWHAADPAGWCEDCFDALNGATK